LVCHPATVDAQLNSLLDCLLATPGIRLARLFGPEHGLLGQEQDLIPAAADNTGLFRCVSLYGTTFASLTPTPDQLAGLDRLIIDLQDVGSRYYTFQATMLYCLEAAARVGLPVEVLDRPNPLGGIMIEGPRVQPGYESFVGPHDIPVRHGLTMGELARLYRAERKIDVDLTVVPCEGWERPHYFDQTGLPWVMPSPNMPTLDTAIVYPGQCLLEGTNLSEGRGTTRPFELSGFPDQNPNQLVQRFQKQNLPGVVARPVHFRPTFQKHAGRECAGCQLHVTDRSTFQPMRTGLTWLAILRDFTGADFAWRTETYEFVSDRLAIDLLCGGPQVREALEAGADPAAIADTWQANAAHFAERRAPHLLY
jgi:uncharacterized protein YbbC (DUF1343 family)